MKKAVIYGAGNIGRGFIGQLFSESGYEIVFIDVNAELIEKLNRDGQYPLTVLADERNTEIIVKPVRGVDGRNVEEVAREIADADIMATAVGVNVLPYIAKPIAEGLEKRWELDNPAPLNIIICENLLNADHYLAQIIEKELEGEQIKRFHESVGLVEASIGRMVPVMTPEMQRGNIARVCVEEYCELQVDRDGFKGKIPAIKNILPESPFKFFIQRKLFIHNMGHALAAYLGGLKGYTYIFEAIGDIFIRNTVLRAMQDSAEALAREHGVDLAMILEHVDDLIYRFGNRQLGDTVRRVGNDTKRKLSSNDRLVGAANLCVQHAINPAYICLGIAAAMKFDAVQGMENSCVFEMMAAGGPERVLKQICNIQVGSMLWNLVLELHTMIDAHGDIYKTMGFVDHLKMRKAR